MDEVIPAVEVTDVTVRYGDVLALDGASVTIESGRVCGVIGMNGAGKSTLFSTIMGLVRPETGQVLVHGHTPTAARRLGLVSHVPQNEAIDLNFPVSVRDVVMMGRYGHLGPYRHPRKADRQFVADALEAVGLSDLAGRQIGQLSGGQRKRAFVARGIAQRATVMLLDEPFAGVDKASEATIIDLLRQLSVDGTTVVVSTHDLQALPTLADEAFLLLHKVIRHGTPAEVLAPEVLVQAFGGAGLDIGGPR